MSILVVKMLGKETNVLVEREELASNTSSVSRIQVQVRLEQCGQALSTGKA